MPSERHDICSRADIIRMVDAFYDAVRSDTLLGRIFDDVARTDWKTHLPKMYDFWETVLFGTRNGFRGNPLAVHRDLAALVPLGEAEFGRWLTLFGRAVDSLFRGPVADMAKLRAGRIATVMREHIQNSEASSAAR